MKKYTFEGSISTLTYSDAGTITVFGENEEEAKRNAIQRICRAQRLLPSSIKINKLLKVE